MFTSEEGVWTDIRANFIVEFTHIANDDEVLPWDLTGGISITHTNGPPVRLTLAEPNRYDVNGIRWFINNNLVTPVDNPHIFTLYPSDYTRFDVGTYSLTVEVSVGGVWYNRTVPFSVN